MSKPTIFFSHSSRDRDSLTALKELFVEKTAGAIDVFLSSDGESIPLGRNWVHRIQEALEGAAMVIVFVTPESIRSDWLFFEAGFAYAKDVRVVPVGFLGVDLAGLPPPLSLLQGFNITSEEGLNNLVALVNEHFGQRHAPSFTREEFLAVCGTDTGGSRVLGPRWSFVDEIRLQVPDLGNKTDEALAAARAVLDERKMSYEATDRGLDSHGVTIRVVPRDEALEVRMDPRVAQAGLTMAAALLRRIRPEGIAGATVRVDFVAPVTHVAQGFRMTGRLDGSSVGLGANGQLVFRDLIFSVHHYEHFTLDGGRPLTVRGRTYLDATMTQDDLPTAQIGELLTILFDRRVLLLEQPLD